MYHVRYVDVPSWARAHRHRQFTVTPMTTTPDERDVPATSTDFANSFRERLLDALAAAIAADGYRHTTVAEIVRRARTSRRTFYQHFADKEACFVALLNNANTDMIDQISAAVDPCAPWRTQVAQAVHAWIATAQAAPALTLSWIRDVPALGSGARELQRDMMDRFVTMLQKLADTEEARAAGISPVPRPLAIMLLGGLRELMASTAEDGGDLDDVSEIAVRTAISLLRSQGTAL